MPDSYGRPIALCVEVLGILAVLLKMLFLSLVFRTKGILLFSSNGCVMKCLLANSPQAVVLFASE